MLQNQLNSIKNRISKPSEFWPWHVGMIWKFCFLCFSIGFAIFDGLEILFLKFFMFFHWFCWIWWFGNYVFFCFSIGFVTFDGLGIKFFMFFHWFCNIMIGLCCLSFCFVTFLAHHRKETNTTFFVGDAGILAPAASPSQFLIRICI